MALFLYPFSGDLSGVMAASTRNALAYNLYQKGKTLFAGFDLVAQASALNTSAGSSAANPFGKTLLAALQAVQPSISPVRAGKVVPVVVSRHNTGTQTANGQALVTLSTGLTMLKGGGFTATTTPAASSLVWANPFSLAPAGLRIHTLYLQLGAPGSTADIHLSLQTGSTPNWVSRFEKSLVLVPQ